MSRLVIACSYTLKLQQYMTAAATQHFTLTTDQQLILSILEDLKKTAGDFSSLAEKAMQHLSSGIIAQFRSKFLPRKNTVPSLKSAAFLLAKNLIEPTN